MIIVTAGCKRFRKLINYSVKQAEKYDYEMQIYDLGDLGFGKPFEVLNSSFKDNGFYKVMNDKSGWCTRALHKPSVIEDALKNHSCILYLDGDAFITDKIDLDMNFDIGVTLRKEGRDGVMGRVNAGVLFFVKTNYTIEFIKTWKMLTIELENDQLALNQLLDENKHECNVKWLPGEIYNNYYDELPEDVKIVHCKNGTNRLFTKFL